MGNPCVIRAPSGSAGGLGGLPFNPQYLSRFPVPGLPAVVPACTCLAPVMAKGAVPFSRFCKKGTVPFAATEMGTAPVSKPACRKAGGRKRVQPPFPHRARHAVPLRSRRARKPAGRMAAGERLRPRPPGDSISTSVHGEDRTGRGEEPVLYSVLRLRAYTTPLRGGSPHPPRRARRVSVRAYARAHTQS